MFKKYWILLITAVMISSCSFFGGDNGGKHMMWEVRTPESTVFLVGSIHMADSSLYPLDNIYYEKLDSSEIFVTEIDIEDVDPMGIMKLIMLRDGKQLKDHVPADIYKKLGEKLESLGIPEQAYQMFKPGFALMMAQMAGDEDNTTKFTSLVEGIDVHLANKAEKHSKLALEDVASQMALLEQVIDVDPEKMRTYLDSDVDSENSMNLNTIIEAWKNADIDKIVELINHSAQMDEDSAKLMEELLDNRNKNMAKKIDAYLVDGGKFYIVVGAAHLCGKNSIIELLEEKGYTVNQL